MYFTRAALILAAVLAVASVTEARCLKVCAESSILPAEEAYSSDCRTMAMVMTLFQMTARM